MSVQKDRGDWTTGLTDRPAPSRGSSVTGGGRPVPAGWSATAGGIAACCPDARSYLGRCGSTEPSGGRFPGSTAPAGDTPSATGQGGDSRAVSWPRGGSSSIQHTADTGNPGTDPSRGPSTVPSRGPSTGPSRESRNYPLPPPVPRHVPCSWTASGPRPEPPPPRESSLLAWLSPPACP